MVLDARGVEVVGEAADGREAVEAVPAHRARRGADGHPDAGARRHRGHPRDRGAAASPTRVLVLTTYDLDRYVYGALRAGAAGFLLKATPPDRLVEGIETVAAGEALLGADR